MKILVTGASGFIGRALCQALIIHGDEVLGLVRSTPCKVPGVQALQVPLDDTVVLAEVLRGVDVVVHMAGRAHLLADRIADPLFEFRAVNCGKTLILAKLAAEVGVRRFVFISSIGVNGAYTNGEPFSELSAVAPHSDYAQSKWEAEQGLWRICHESGMELVVVRPPLVYGRNSPGSFGSLVRLIEKGFPLPLGAVHNRRSLVALDNLVDLIIACIDHPAAANQVFLAGDGEDISTTELLHKVGRAMGKPARLFPVPVILLKLGAAILFRKAVAQSLLGSLQVDISKSRELLGWTPPVSLDEGLRRCFSIDGGGCD